MKYLFIIAAILTSSIAWSQSTFEVRTSAERMMIGDQIEVQLQAVVHRNDEVKWPAFPGQVQFGSFIDRKGIDTTTNGDEMTLTETWILTSFDSGFAVVAPLEILVNDVSRAAEPILIQVDLAEKGPEYRDIESPLSSEEHVFWLWLILISIIVIAIGVIIYTYIKKKPSELARPKATVHNITEVFIETLKDEQAKLTDEPAIIDEVLSATTMVLHGYLNLKFTINTAVGSPDEWDKELSSHEGVKSGVVSKILNDISRLRFSGQTLTKAQAYEIIERANEWMYANSKVQAKTEEHELV